jgi:YbbR domain-containing protein
MDKRTHRIISILLAISLFFAGMYINTLLTKDLFAYDLTGTMTASLSPIHLDINDDAICTTALPAINNIDLQSQTRYQQRYREINEFLYLLCPDFSAISQGKSYVHHITTYLFYQTQNELVTEYVYQSDGKKRI